MQKSTLILWCFFLITAFTACNDDEEEQTTSPILDKLEAILDELATRFQQMPEAQVSISRDQSVLAQYINQTDKYPHSILGDELEATGLVAVYDEQFYTLELSENYVFEDIRPRLYDVDRDGMLEIICIRTEVNGGAGIVIYKLLQEQLKEFAFVPVIGKRFRWLNIAAIDDLDNDGTVELAWIETPHIGGKLKVAKIEAGEMEILDQASLYSNHGVGKTNLCLSVVTEANGSKLLYVPNQLRNKIVGFSLINNTLSIQEEIEGEVNFSIPLEQQYDFENIVREEDNCIYID